MISGEAITLTMPSLRLWPHTTVSFGAPSEKLSLPVLGREFFFAETGAEQHELHRKGAQHAMVGSITLPFASLR